METTKGERKGFLSVNMIFASVVFSATTILSAEAGSLPYYDPPPSWWPSYSYAFKGASSILRETGERLLLMATHPTEYRATSVVVIVNKEYSLVRDHMQQLVRNRWGISDEQENYDGPIHKSPPHLGGDEVDWPVLGEGLGYLMGDGPANRLKEYQVTSQKYNKIEDLEAYSQVQIRVSDAKELLGRALTILQIRRSDWSREWARSSWHGIFPLPYKEKRASLGLVTSTEVSLVEELKKHVPGLATRYLMTQSLRSSPDYRKAVLTKMGEVAKEF